MNKANLLRVADAIEKHEIAGLGYNQIMWVSTELPDNTGQGCGTTACLAGWAYALAKGLSASDLINDRGSIIDVAAEYLELDTRQPYQLFRACPVDHIDDTVRDLHARHAINTLRHAAEHDVVDWDAANPPEVESVTAA